MASRLHFNFVWPKRRLGYLAQEYWVSPILLMESVSFRSIWETQSLGQKFNYMFKFKWCVYPPFWKRGEHHQFLNHVFWLSREIEKGLPRSENHNSSSEDDSNFSRKNQKLSFDNRKKIESALIWSACADKRVVFRRENRKPLTTENNKIKSTCLIKVWRTN